MWVRNAHLHSLAMAKIRYTYGDKSPSPDFLCILWILLFEQEKNYDLFQGGRVA